MEFGEASLLRPALPPGIDGIGIAHAVFAIGCLPACCCA